MRLDHVEKNLGTPKTNIKKRSFLFAENGILKTTPGDNQPFIRLHVLHGASEFSNNLHIDGPAGFYLHT